MPHRGPSGWPGSCFPSQSHRPALESRLVAVAGMVANNTINSNGTRWLPSASFEPGAKGFT